MRTWTLLPLAALIAGCPAPPADGTTPPEAPVGATSLAVCAAGDGELTEVWAVDNGHGAVSALAVSPDGSVALAGEDLTIKLWNVETGELDWAAATSGGGMYGSEFGSGTPLNSLGFDQAGALLLGGDDAGGVTAWSRETGETLHTWTVSEQPVTAAATSWEGEWFAAATAEFGGELRSWFAASGPESFALETDLWFVNAIAPMHADDQWIVAGDVYGEPAFEVRSMSFGAVLTHGIARGRTGTINTVDRAGDRVVVGGPGFVGVFEPNEDNTESPPTAWLELDHDVVSVTALDEDSFAAATADGQLLLGSLEDLTIHATLQTAVTSALSPVPGGWQLASSGPDGVLRLFGCEG